MPTGIRTTLSNVTIAGVTYNGAVDLENVFHARGTAAAVANSGFVNGAGADLSTLFYPRSLGGTLLAVDTGLRTGAGTDLRQLYAQKGTVSTGGGGSSGGGGGCLPFGTRVLLWGGGDKKIEELVPGDVLIGYQIVGMVDESEPNWLSWSTSREEGTSGMHVPVAVAMTMHADYPSHWLINGELRATYEHRFLVLRDNLWSWIAARDLVPGDAFLSMEREEVPIVSVEFVEKMLRVANLNVEATDSYLFRAFGEQAIVSHNETVKN